MKIGFNIQLVILISLSSVYGAQNAVNQNSGDDSSDGKGTDQKFLLKSGSIVALLGLICIISLLTIYTALQYRRKSLLSKQNENTDDKEKGNAENSLDELFQSTANDDDKFKDKDNLKRKSFPSEEDEQAGIKISGFGNTKGFLFRAMTLPQAVIGKIQTIQITEPSTNVEQSLSSSNKQQSNNQTPNQGSTKGNSPSSSSNLISTTCSPTQVERPANLNKKTKPTAVKSPSSNYLKKSPSPTGSKNPPQQTDQNEKTETKNDETTNASKEQEIANAEASTTSSMNRFEPDDSFGEFKLGKIQFCLKYNYSKHAITISLIKCINLPGKNTMNTYVKIQLLPEKKHKVKTRTIRKNQNPCFQEEFTFYNIQPTELENLALHFMIMSFDRYSRDEVLGEVLHPCGDQFDTLEKQVCLTLDIAHKGLLLKTQGRGEILVSLCYNTSACLLSLVVLKAKNLPKVNITGLPDPYVKINLMINNKRISKKKTHSKKRTLNPIYNEIFSFDLSNEIPNSSSADDNVDFKIWENIKLELIVIDYDRITRNENIGCLTLCINSTDPEIRKHMKEMLSSPRKQIAQWHRLQGME